VVGTAAVPEVLVDLLRAASLEADGLNFVSVEPAGMDEDACSIQHLSVRWQ
jgi:hypothetical protein